MVRKDNTVTLDGLILQLEPTRERRHFIRCPVTVHRFFDGTLGISYQGQLLQSFDNDGVPLAALNRRAA